MQKRKQNQLVPLKEGLHHRRRSGAGEPSWREEAEDTAWDARSELGVYKYEFKEQGIMGMRKKFTHELYTTEEHRITVQLLEPGDSGFTM